MDAASRHAAEDTGPMMAVSGPAEDSPQLAPDLRSAPQPARPGRRARVLGWSAAAMISVSVVLMALVLAAGPSLTVPRLRPSGPVPPLWLPLHPSAVIVTLALYSAFILGGAGVACGLVAVQRGVRPRMRVLLGAAGIAVAALTILPPGGSTDSLSYAAYGRIAVDGHNPYVMTPLQLRDSGDPIGRQTTTNWSRDPSLYGPVATAVNWAAAELGGTSIAVITFWLKVVFALSFGAVALALDRLLRGDPAARARAHLLWTVNPLMLWAVVGGAHADGLGAALGITGIIMARPGGAAPPPAARVGMARALGAGLLIGAAVAVKAPLFPLGLGVAWAVRRSPRDLLAAAAGGLLVPAAGYLVAGGTAITDLWTVGHGLVTFDSFWRLFYSPFGYTSAPGGLEALAVVGFAGVAALLAWRLPPGPPALPAVRPALVILLAWLLVYPLQRPWYDAAAFCLLAVYCVPRLDWLMLTRAAPATMALATGTARSWRPPWLRHLISFTGYDLTRWARLSVLIATVALCVLAAWEPRRPWRERLIVRAVLSRAGTR